MIDLILDIFFTIVLTVTGSALFLGFFRAVSTLRRDNAYIRNLPQVEGPPPGHPFHDSYMRRLEHDTVSPLGVDRLHCADCETEHTAGVDRVLREIEKAHEEQQRKLQRDRWRAEALEREARCPHGTFNKLGFLHEERAFWKCQDCGKRMADDFDPWNWSAS